MIAITAHRRDFTAARCRLLGLAIVVFVSGLAVGSPAQAAELNSDAGRIIDDFSLYDTAGRVHRLADWPTAKPLVVVFVGVECPLVRLYVPRLREVAERFGERGIGFLAIDSNWQDSADEVRQFADDARLGFPVLCDPTGTVADRLGARRTPEAVLLDRSRRVCYRGRIDDQFGFDGAHSFQRPMPVRCDLVEAIEEVLSGRAVTLTHAEPAGCLIGRAPRGRVAEVTWSGQIEAIMQQRCQSCHRPGEIGPFSLLTYEDAAPWADTIAEVVSSGRMPPWHADAAEGVFANDPRLSAEERSLIARWAAEGAAQGDPALAPPPVTFPEGWQIGEPDAIYYMSDEPFAVPAEGLVEYQTFVVDPQLTSDCWVAAAECRPGARNVVHHINVFVLPPEMGDDFSRDELTNELLSGYAPGHRATPFPDDAAFRIPAGAKLVFQLHYTPSGRVERDRSCLGLRFARPEDVARQVRTALAVNATFEIPPEAARHQVEAQYDFQKDVELLGLIPHMHLRGRSFVYEAFYLDGNSEVLLNVPRYDFNFQSHYIFRRPKRLPAGTIVRCTATFDNSAENLNNPDPLVAVRWGDQTTDEMMIGYLYVAPLDGTDQVQPAVGLAAAPAQPAMRRSAERLTWSAAIIALVLAATGGWFGSRRWLRQGRLRVKSRGETRA